jgi:hypothetical protein
MTDPLAPRPCKDCGKELPYRVLEAGDFLYGGGDVTAGTNLADKIAEYMEEEPRLRARGERPRDDTALVELAISWMLDFIRPEHFAAAVRHCGYLGHEDGRSECERILHAKFCHEPNPSSTGIDDPRPLTCVLDAHGPETPHVFEYAATAAAS